MIRLGKRRLLLAALLVLALAVPLPYTLAPHWPVRLVDIAGVPQVGIEAVETWRHPLLQPELRREVQTSDSEGRVVFPERRVWTNGFSYLYRGLANLAANGLAASFAADAQVIASKEGYNGGDFWISGREPAATVILHRDGVCPADERQAPAT